MGSGIRRGAERVKKCCLCAAEAKLLYFPIRINDKGLFLLLFWLLFLFSAAVTPLTRVQKHTYIRTMGVRKKSLPTEKGEKRQDWKEFRGRGGRLKWNWGKD